MRVDLSYDRTSERCRLPGRGFLLGQDRAAPVVETSDGSYLNTADLVASGYTSYVGTSANHGDGTTGAVRMALLVNSFCLPAEVHGPTEPPVRLCMPIPEYICASLVTSSPTGRGQRIRDHGLVQVLSGPGARVADFIQECPVITR